MSANYPIYKPEICDSLPAMFDNGETVKEVCLKLGIDEKTFDEWRTQYPDFNDAAELGELHAECFYEDLLVKSIELDTDDICTEIMELMRKRFPETYSYS